MKEYAWAIVFPSGTTVSNSAWDEDGAWRFASGGAAGDPVPDASVVADLRAAGFRVLRVRLFEVGPA